VHIRLPVLQREETGRTSQEGSRFGTLVRRVEWSADRTQVRLEGSGAWIELRLEGHVVHAAADIPVLGRFLGGSVTTLLREILHRTFQLQLRGGKEDA
jgi:hypothetical protein